VISEGKDLAGSEDGAGAVVGAPSKRKPGWRRDRPRRRGAAKGGGHEGRREEGLVNEVLSSE